MTIDDKLEDKILSILLAASTGESGSAWLTSDELFSYSRKIRHALTLREVLQAAGKLSSRGLIEWLPVSRNNQTVGFTARISRQGRNWLVYGQPSLIGI